MPISKYEKIKHDRPYQFVLSDGDCYIFYIGPGHCCDPSDPKWDTVKKFWSSFLESTNKKNCVVIVEGGAHALLKSKDFLEKAQLNKEEELIKEGGEFGLVMLLAWQNGIPADSPGSGLSS
jgi:hypothetical protein